MGFFVTDTLSRILRSRKRDRALAEAAAWPTVEAKLLKGTILVKDELAEGTAAQDSQLEFPFYFTLPGEGPRSGYFGGHLRTAPLSHSEASRLLPQVAEGTLVRVRYNPKNPDEAHALDSDNEGLLPVRLWSI
jgi:hypothetical protein